MIPRRIMPVPDAGDPFVQGLTGAAKPKTTQQTPVIQRQKPKPDMGGDAPDDAKAMAELILRAKRDAEKSAAPAATPPPRNLKPDIGGEPTPPAPSRFKPDLGGDPVGKALEQGLTGGKGGNAPISTDSSPEAKKLADLLENMKKDYAPYQAIEQVQNRLDEQNLTDAIGRMKENYAPEQAIASAQNQLDKLRYPYAKPDQTPGELYRGQDDAEVQKYRVESDKIANNALLPDFAKKAQQAALDNQYAGMQDKQKKQQLDDANEQKLKNTTDEINSLKDQMDYYEGHMSMQGMLPPLRAKYDELKKKLGIPGVTGLDGGKLDPAKIVDIKIDGENIVNARCEKGHATADMENTVRALGGSIKWDSAHTSADIRDADGRFVTSIKISNGQAWEVDMRGKPVRQFAMTGSAPQADIVGMGERLGVPVSKFHDKNGILHLYAQPEMRNQPLQIVRNENDVTFYINMDYEGRYANQIHPDTLKKDANGKIKTYTYAELTALGIKERWGDGKTFNIGGKIKIPDPNGPYKDKNGSYRLEYADPTDNVTVHVKIFSNNPSSSNVWEKPHNPDQKMGKTELIDKQGKLESHAMTLDPFSLHQGMTKEETDAFIKELEGNMDAVFESGQLEKALFNWKMNDQGTAYIYPYDTAESQKRTGAHENVHISGVYDPYGSNLYRFGERSPDVIELNDTYGNKRNFEVKDDDLMMYGDYLSETDLVMMMKAGETGEPQYFPKGDDTSTENIKKDKWWAILKYLVEGKIKP